MDTIKNKYDINGVIGSGAFGRRIYRITDKKVRTEYILKELTKINGISLNITDKKEYENEINFLKNVKGKNILNIIDYYQDDKDIFLLYYIRKNGWRFRKVS